LLTVKKNKYLDWPEFLHAVDVCMQELDNLNTPFTKIYAPIRGGLIPAIMMSHYFSVPVHPLDTRELNALRSPDLKGAGTVLLLDDISDTGETFRKCAEYLNDQGYIVITCAIVMKKETRWLPDVHAITMPQEEYLIFPYERKK